MNAEHAEPLTGSGEVVLPAIGGQEAGELLGDLTVPDQARGIVVFAHGSGSSRHSSRNRWVATELRRSGLATLLMDLLSAEEERRENRGAQLRFDIELLTRRVLGAVDRLSEYQRTRELPVALFGASTGAAAALGAAAERPDAARAVVSRGGRPDLAPRPVEDVRAPTLLIVGGRDEEVLALNRGVAERMSTRCEVRVVEGATHLFEEPGALEEVSTAAADWLSRHV